MAPRMKLSRRQWIMGSTLIGVGAALAWNTTGYHVPRRLGARLRTLSPKELLILSAVARRIVRSDGSDLPAPDEVELPLALDRLVGRIGDHERTELGRLLQLVEHALPPMSGRLSRFTRLEGSHQDAVLEAMMTSPILLLRGAFEALKSLIMLAYFAHPATWPAIGYSGPTIGLAPDHGDGR